MHACARCICPWAPDSQHFRLTVRKDDDDDDGGHKKT